jgi:uncharacterized protein with HEPN domain
VKDDRIYLDHIDECLQWIARYTADGKEAFFSDRKTQSAVLRELQTLAESAQRLSSALKEAHPEVPWRGIAGFRNVLVHDYLGIKLDRVWEIVERDLPALRVAVKAMQREVRDEKE